MNIYVGIVRGFRDEVSIAATSLAVAKRAFLDAIQIDKFADLYFWKPTTVNKKRAYKLLCHDSEVTRYNGGCGHEVLLGWIVVTELIGAKQ